MAESILYRCGFNASGGEALWKVGCTEIPSPIVVFYGRRCRRRMRGLRLAFHRLKLLTTSSSSLTATFSRRKSLREKGFLALHCPSIFLLNVRFLSSII